MIHKANFCFQKVSETIRNKLPRVGQYLTKLNIYILWSGSSISKTFSKYAKREAQTYLPQPCLQEQNAHQQGNGKRGYITKEYHETILKEWPIVTVMDLNCAHPTKWYAEVINTSNSEYNCQQDERQPSEWEKISANEATDKGLISKICKQLTQLNIKKQIIQSKNWWKT